MKTLAKWTVMGAFVVIAAVVAAPAVQAGGGDDVAGFYVAERLLAGSVVLEPGVYLIREADVSSSRNVLVVTNVDGTKVFATLLATPHQIAAQEMRGVSRLLYEAGDGTRPNALRTFLSANSTFGYDFVARPGEVRVASTPLKEITATAMLR